MYQPNSSSKFLLCLAALGGAAFIGTAPAEAGKISGCSVNGKQLKGTVKIVSSQADIKVQIVDSFADIKVKRVSSFPSSCGEWKFVSSSADFTIQYVNSSPDIKVQFVDSFPGVN